MLHNAATHMDTTYHDSYQLKTESLAFIFDATINQQTEPADTYRLWVYTAAFKRFSSIWLVPTNCNPFELESSKLYLIIMW